MNKKICIVTNTAWNIINFRWGLVEKLQENGYSVILVAPKDDFTQEIEKRNCIFIPLQNLSRKGTNPFQDLYLIRELYTIYKKHAIDIVLHFTIKPNIYGSFAASLAKIPSVATVTGLGYTFMQTGIINTIAKRLYKSAFKRTHKVIFQNIDDELLFTETKLVAKNKATIIRGSGINTNFFTPTTKTENNTNFVFLFIGRLLTDKGIREYVEAAKLVLKKYPTTIFRVLGALDKDNPAAIQETELNEWIANNWIQYEGVTKDTRPFIANADIMVLPSYREGLPRVMLEGMAMGKPLITTQTAGCRDTVINGENGILVPIKEVEPLADAMIQMIHLSQKELLLMGEKGREFALKEFDEKIIIQKYIGIIKNLILSKK